VAQCQAGAVLEHDPAEVAGDFVGVDRGGEATLDEQRQSAARIDVRMTQDHRIDACRIEQKNRAVAVVAPPAALDQPAVEQDLAAAGAQDVTRSRNLAGTAVEFQFEGCCHRVRPTLRFPVAELNLAFAEATQQQAAGESACSRSSRSLHSRATSWISPSA